jgi:membrane protease YdiL (CAAX protease family)
MAMNIELALRHLCTAVLAQADSETKAGSPIEGITTAVCVIGTVILAVWLVRDRGPLALRGCPNRRNRLPFLLPVALIGLWIFLTGLSEGLKTLVLSHAPENLQTLYSYGSMMLIYLFLIGLMLALAHTGFARGIRGLGLRVRTIPRDLGMALVNLLACYPLVLLAVAAVVFVGQQLAGPDFQFEKNPALKDFTESPSLALTIMLAVFTIGLVPVFEELMFRGMLQTTLRGYLARPWLAILITAVLFALLHPTTHWPALFILGCAFGYTYEKSGSLLRAIFFHAMFNGFNLLASRFGA